MPSFKYCGCYETAIVKAVNARTYKDDKNDKVLQTIKFNRKIRDLFATDFQFGVIGKKKLGKSTFVQTVLPDAKVKDADANIGTTKLTPYIITDLVTLNDYPHFDSTDLSHKIQFMFTRFLIDHIFFVCDSKERMESEGTMDVFDLIKNGCGDNFTILLNRIDDSLKDCSNHSDYGYNVLVELKKEILLGNRNDRRSIGVEYNKNMIFTYLERLDDRVNLDQLDRMENLNANRKKRLDCLANLKKIKDRLAVFDQIYSFQEIWKKFDDLAGDDVFKKALNQENSRDMQKILFMLKIIKDLNLINDEDIIELYTVLIELEKNEKLVGKILINENLTIKSDVENLEKNLAELKAIITKLKFKNLETLVQEKIYDLDKCKTKIESFRKLGEREKESLKFNSYNSKLNNGYEDILTNLLLISYLKLDTIFHLEKSMREQINTEISIIENNNSVEMCTDISICTHEKVYETFYGIILNKIPNREKYIETKREIENKRKNNKPKHKFIWIRYKNANHKNLLNFDKNDIIEKNGYTPIDSFKTIVKDFKDHGLKNPVIRSNFENDFLISSMEHFVTSRYHTFKVFDEKKIDLNNKRIKIETEEGKNKGCKKLTLDKNTCDSSDDDCEIIDSLENLEDQFFGRNKKNPKFVPKSNRNQVIATLEDFFKTDEDTFVVFYDT